MATNWQQHQIVGGPSKFDLMVSLFQTWPKQLVVFTLKDDHGVKTTCNIEVNLVGNWVTLGQLDGEIDRQSDEEDADQDGDFLVCGITEGDEFAEVKAYYNLRTRLGYMLVKQPA